MGKPHIIIRYGIEKEVIKLRELGYGPNAIHDILKTRDIIKSDMPIRKSDVKRFVESSKYAIFKLGKPTQLYEMDMRKVHLDIYEELSKRIDSTKRKRYLLDKKLKTLTEKGITKEFLTKEGVVKMHKEGYFEIKALIDSWAKLIGIENKMLENLARMKGDLNEGVTINLVKVENMYNSFMSIVFDVLRDHKVLRDKIERKLFETEIKEYKKSPTRLNKERTRLNKNGTA